MPTTRQRVTLTEPRTGRTIRKGDVLWRWADDVDRLAHVVEDIVVTPSGGVVLHLTTWRGSSHTVETAHPHTLGLAVAR